MGSTKEEKNRHKAIRIKFSKKTSLSCSLFLCMGKIHALAKKLSVGKPLFKNY